MSIEQCDKDRANELRQKLGTMSEEFNLKCGPKPSISEMIWYEESCYQLAVELFAKHREASQ